MPFLKIVISGRSSAGLEVPLTLCLKRQAFTSVHQMLKGVQAFKGQQSSDLLKGDSKIALQQVKFSQKRDKLESDYQS